MRGRLYEEAKKNHLQTGGRSSMLCPGAACCCRPYHLRRSSSVFHIGQFLSRMKGALGQLRVKSAGLISLNTPGVQAGSVERRTSAAILNRES